AEGYQAQGQGRLFSDAEFFQFCGSPDEGRHEIGNTGPPLPASRSSEDALTRFCRESRRNNNGKNTTNNRNNRKSSAHGSGELAREARASSSLLSSPLVLPQRSPGTSGDVVGAAPAPALPLPAPAAMRPGGERQFLYIQMEYCENTLRHLIDHAELWREEQRCWKLFRQMLEGVEFIHSKGIIHRDLTPPNVFLDGEENVKLGDFGLATSKKVRAKTFADSRHKGDLGSNSSPSSDEGDRHHRGVDKNDDGDGDTGDDDRDKSGSIRSALYPSVFGELSMSGDTSQLTDGVGTGPYIAPEQGARFGQYNHKADMWSLGVILFEMLAPRFSTLMERAGVMTALRTPGGAVFPPAFEERVPDNAKQMIRWLLAADADARPTAAELLSSPLLPPKLEVEASFLRHALRVMGNPESDTFQVVVKALMDQDTAEHVEHWYDHEPLKAASARIPIETPAISFVCDGLRRVFETHGATPVAPPTIRPKPPPSLAPPLAAAKGLVHLLDHKGAVVTLPGDLTAPFARFVARSGATRLKRYQIDRIFLAAGRGGAAASDPQRGGGSVSTSSSSPSAMEAWEADFDIISSGHSSPSTLGAACGSVGAATGFPEITNNARGVFGGVPGGEGEGGGQFEVAEAEAVLVVSQVMGAFESFLGPWLLRLGNVKMSQAILELCGVPHDARATVIGLLGKLSRGSVTAAKAFAEVESKDVLSGDALLNLRPFLHPMGTDPFEALTRLEVLVQRIPAVKSVMNLPGGGRRRDLTRKEAVRTKRSLRLFLEAREGLAALALGLARLGIASKCATFLAFRPRKRTGGSLDRNELQARPHRNKHFRTPVPARPSHPHEKTRPSQTRSERTGSRDGRPHADSSADSRAGGGDRSDGADPRRVSNSRSHHKGGGGNTGTGGHLRSSGTSSNNTLGVGRTGGELHGDSWGGGVVPSFVMLDLGLTQRQGSYASGTVFQAVLVGGGGSLGGRGSEAFGSSFTVAEGGRYDDLVTKHRYHLRSTSKMSGTSTLCAVGVRFAVEKLASLLVNPRKESRPGVPRRRPKNQISRPSVDAVVCAGGGFEAQGLQERILVAARLWAGGIRAEYLATDALVRAGARKGGGLEGAAEACLSLGIPFVVVVRPHTLVAKKAVKVISVLEKGGGQLEVPLDHLAQHVTDALAALADPATASGASSSGTTGGTIRVRAPQESAADASSRAKGCGRCSSERKSGAGVSSMVKRYEDWGPPKRKMSRQDYRAFSAMERRVASHLDAAISGPIEGKREGDGPLVLASEGSFAAIRGLTTCYMLYGAESKAMLEFLSDHPEKKVIRNLLTALQQVEDGGRRRGGGG
ncbi:unnamed protein product, partial [Scytosiphon promiscuus]